MSSQSLFLSHSFCDGSGRNFSADSYQLIAMMTQSNQANQEDSSALLMVGSLHNGLPFTLLPLNT